MSTCDVSVFFVWVVNDESLRLEVLLLRAPKISQFSGADETLVLRVPLLKKLA